MIILLIKRRRPLRGAAEGNEESAMKHMKKFACLLMAGCMLLALAACGDSGSGKKTLTLGTSADYPPFEFHILQDSKDTIVGLDIAVAKKIAEEMDAELVIKDIPFDSLLIELSQGSVDFVMAAMEQDPEREGSADFSKPYYTDVPPKIVVRAADASGYTSLADFSGKTVGAQTATTKADAVAEYMPDAKPLLLQSVNELVNSLVNNKCDAIVLDGAVADKYVATNSDIVTLDSVPLGDASALYCVAVKEGDPDGLLPSINKILESINKDGQLTAWAEEADTLSSQAIGLE